MQTKEYNKHLSSINHNYVMVAGFKNMISWDFTPKNICLQVHPQAHQTHPRFPQ